MSKEEWNQHVQLLQLHVNEFNEYEAGLNYKQKEKLCHQRFNTIRNIKRDLTWPPFAQIVQEVSNSSF